MRVLVFTHGRSGGLMLCTWICSEMKVLPISKILELYHEPDIKDDTTLKKIFQQNDIVTKLMPFSLIDQNIDIKKLLSTFDKVICHKRMNYRDTAISKLKGYELEKIDKKLHNWHEPYVIDEDWINKNNQEIDELSEEVKKEHELIDMYTPSNAIVTTYEKIYEEKTDIDRLCEFFEIKNPRFLDKLNNRHRLRNGIFGMNDTPLKKTLI